MPTLAWDAGCGDCLVSHVRRLAAQVLARVVRGNSLNDVLPPVLESVTGRDRAFLQALCFVCLRHYHRLDFILSRLLQKPIKDAEIHALALVGLAQIGKMGVKPHAAVAETVSASGRKRWARSLLNALLRNYLRRRADLEAAADTDYQASVSHPAWLRRRIERAWPRQAESIMRVNNTQPPLVLRLNPGRSKRDAYLERLRSIGLSARGVEGVPTAIELERPVDVAELPGFSSGVVSVQDGAAQLAAPLLAVRQGMRVLDVCAAPGGKTAHILETCPEVEELVAVDVSRLRLDKVKQNLDRLGDAGRVKLVCADARTTQWWDGRPFDRILLDAPCSATGVIRRHPDIKLLRREEDVSTLAGLQLEILEAVWPLLAQGGVLLYATCSILPEENEKQIQGFAALHRDARVLPIEADWGTATGIGRQILPGKMDGFYYARLEKCVV